MGGAVDLSIQSLHIAGFSSLMGTINDSQQCPISISLSSIFFPFGKPRINAKKRIGPHDHNVIAQIIGSLQGDCYGEKIKGPHSGTRICFQQENSNVSYIKWVYKYLKIRGYCFKQDDRQKKEIRIGKNGKKRFLYRFKTFSFFSFNWLQYEFYPNRGSKPEKIIPMRIIDKYFTPLSFAILVMDDGTRCSSGQRLCLQGYTKENVIEFKDFIIKKFNQEITLQISNKEKNQYYLYIKKKSIDKLFDIIKPYQITSMYYKLGK